MSISLIENGTSTIVQSCDKVIKNWNTTDFVSKYDSIKSFLKEISFDFSIEIIRLIYCSS